MATLIIQRADHGVSICSLTEGSVAQEEFDKWVAVAHPSWLPATYTFCIDAPVLPDKKLFRGAWKTDGINVTVDMPRARELHKETLRKMRAVRMAELDVAAFKAVEDGNTIKLNSVKTLKQRLRDVTNDLSIVSAKTPEDLAKVIPSILTEDYTNV